MRFIYYKFRSISLLVLLISISPNSANLQFNVTINPTHPSISYSPPTSWTALTTTNLASELQNPDCTQQQPLAFYATSVRDVEELGPSHITTGVTVPGKELDNRRTQIRSTHCRGRGGGECDISDTIPQGHLDGTHWPITFRFKFIGSAVYVFGFAIPPSLIDSASTIGVTFTIDGEQLQTLASDTRKPFPCSMNGPVFSHGGLSDDREHELVVTISPSWKFFLNSIIFTHSGVDSALRSFPSPPVSVYTPSSRTILKVLKPRTEEDEGATSTTDHTKKHNIATFVAATISVVGVLAIISLIVTFSIIRRRRRARQRDLTENQHTSGGAAAATTTTTQFTGEGIIPRIRARRISSSTFGSTSSTVLHTEASEDTPNPNFDLNAVVNNAVARGVMPFVPRFFHSGMTVLHSSVAGAEDGRRRSRGRDEVPPPSLASEGDFEREDDGVLPPPYDGISVGIDPIHPGMVSRIISPPNTTNRQHLPIDDAEEDQTYADAPPPGTPPPLPSRPPSPASPPPPPILSSSDMNPLQSQSSSYSQSPPQPTHPVRDGSGCQTSSPFRSSSPSLVPPLPPAPVTSESRGPPPGLN